jgi:succinate-semialdehyde dehydrogenase/glutarate-semialdehyde dehydrogenase
MPWNFPFWQVIRFAAPALAAGNAVLLKHASNVPQCALAVEDVFRRAGAPPGVFQTLLIEASQVEGVLRDTRVAAATLTGSEGAGSSVASIAGSVLKKSVLELGGSDPFMVLPSADIAAAAAAAARGRTVNAGQSCIASKRFIVVEACAAEFEKLLVREMQTLKVGSPLSEDTDIGPLATAQVLADVHEQVTDAVKRGARIATGGTPVAGAGWFYPPTVLLEVDTESSVWQDEVFGPVAPVVRVTDAQAALALANNSRYGLGASVWTINRDEVVRFTEELQCGMVFVNAIVHSDVRLPFGGIKRSGFGRELADLGLHEFTNAKTIRIPAALSEGL